MRNAFLQTLNQLISSLHSDLLSNYISVRLMEKANALDLSYFENAQFYDKLGNATREAGYRPGQMVQQLFGLLRSGVTLVAVIGVLASLSWWLVLLVVVSIPSLAYQAKYSGQFFALLTSRTPEQRRLTYLFSLLTTEIAPQGTVDAGSGGGWGVRLPHHAQFAGRGGAIHGNLAPEWCRQRAHAAHGTTIQRLKMPIHGSLWCYRSAKLICDIADTLFITFTRTLRYTKQETIFDL